MDKNFKKAYYAQFTKEKKVLENLTFRTDKACTESLVTKYASKLLLIAGYFIFAVIFYTSYSKWSVLDSFYFAIVTMFTVGWTDLYPSNDNAKIATIFLIVFGFFLFTSMLTEAVRIAVLRADSSANAFDMKLRKRAREYMKYSTLHEDATGPTQSAVIVSPNFDTYAWLLVSLALIFIGAGFLCWNEQWLFLDAVYFCLTAMTTVAYGNGSGYPSKDSSSTFLCIYIPICVFTLAYAVISGMESTLTEALKMKRVWRLHSDVNTNSLRAYYERPDLRVGKHEFCLAMMLSLGNVSEDEIELWMCRFEELDCDKRGHVTSGDATKATAFAYMNRRVFQEVELVSSSTRSSQQTFLGWVLDFVQQFKGRPSNTKSSPDAAVSSSLSVRMGQRPARLDATEDARTDLFWATQTQTQTQTQKACSDRQPVKPCEASADYVTDFETGLPEGHDNAPGLQTHLESLAVAEESKAVFSLPPVSPAAKPSKSGLSSTASPSVFRNTTEVKVVGPTIHQIKPGATPNKRLPMSGDLSRLDSLEEGVVDNKDNDSPSVGKKSTVSRKPIFRKTVNTRQVAVTPDRAVIYGAPSPDPELGRVLPQKETNMVPFPVRGPKLGNLLFSRERELLGDKKDENGRDGGAPDWDFYSRFGGGETHGSSVPEPQAGRETQLEAVEKMLFKE